MKTATTVPAVYGLLAEFDKPEDVVGGDPRRLRTRLSVHGGVHAISSGRAG